MSIRIILSVILRLSITLISLLGFSQSAEAAYGIQYCAVFYPSSQVYTMPLSFSVIRDAPVGTTIYDSGWISTQAAVYNVQDGCYGSLVSTMVAPIKKSSVGKNVYETSVPGIGIQIVNDRSAPLPQYPGAEWSTNVDGGTGWKIFSAHWKIILIVTGPVGSGSFQWPSGDLSRYYVSRASDNVSPQILFSSLSIAGAVNVVAPACTATNSATTVQLPVSRASQFVGIGTTLGKTPFNIALTCDPGVKVSYRIDSNNQINDILNNSTGNGNATGVGVQLLDDKNTPLKLATKVLATTTSSGNQAVNIPLSAQYYQTSVTVTGGLVKASATLTMYYE